MIKENKLQDDEITCMQATQSSNSAESNEPEPDVKIAGWTLRKALFQAEQAVGEMGSCIKAEAVRRDYSLRDAADAQKKVDTMRQKIIDLERHVRNLRAAADAAGLD